MTSADTSTGSNRPCTNTSNREYKASSKMQQAKTVPATCWKGQMTDAALHNTFVCLELKTPRYSAVVIAYC